MIPLSLPVPARRAQRLSGRSAEEFLSDLKFLAGIQYFRQQHADYGKQSVRAGTLNRQQSATLKERLRARGAPKSKIRSGHFLEVVIVDLSSAGRHQENFGRTSAKDAKLPKVRMPTVILALRAP
jgi:hypothetical protein